MTLTISSVAMLYVVCFMGKRIEHGGAGRLLAYCGKESFYIMGLHFIGFKMGTYLLLFFGINLSLSSLMAPAGDSLVLLAIYLLTGMLFPLAFMWIFRKAKIILLNSFKLK